MKNTVTAIDFGTSKIVTLVAENSGAARCDIIGAGISTYDGFLEEGWNNPALLDEAIRNSITEAETQSKHKIKEISVGVPGAFTRVYATEAVVQIKGTEPVVKPADVKEIFKEAAHNLEQLPGFVIHTTPAWFMVDNGKKTLEPVGLKGRELRGMISFVVANQFFIEDVQMRLQNMGINANGFYSTPAGEAMLYLPEEDRDRTAVLIDIGYLNTEVMVVEGDALLFDETIDLGGGLFAADLAESLGISLESAEQLKRQFVYGLAGSDNESFTVQGAEGAKSITVEREKVAAVLEADVEDLANQIERAIADSGCRLGSWSNYYLTGGGLCLNRGGKDFLAAKLNRPVRETPKRTTKLNSHVFSSSLGLMDLIINTLEQQKQPSAGLGGRVRDFFRSLVNG